MINRISNTLIAFTALYMTVQTCNAFPRNNNMKSTKYTESRWSEEDANKWYSTQPWMAGCDYIPATAINQIEMWHHDTFNAPQINKELTWAEDLGFNTMRVFLSSVVYKNDAEGLKQRMNDFLNICDQHHIRPIFVFFDDCWNRESHYGPQLQPRPGVHNSGWVQDPSYSLRQDTMTLYADLKKYVQDIVGCFAKDKRVLMWDLYNEPGNSGYNETSLPLLKKVFLWARSCHPSQPLTSGIWYTGCPALNAFQLTHSDVISYHNYSDEKDHGTEISYLKMLNRPLVCTEYMARKNGSRFDNIMPLLKKEKVVAVNWGFVSGKTNTIFAWSEPMPNVKEPPIWFHDILRQDGSPFSLEEVKLIKSLTKEK